MPFRNLSDEQLAKAKEMLDAGASVTETSRATGISVTTLYKRFKGKADPTPGGKRKTATPNRPSPTDEQLTAMFTKVAVAPAIPAGLVLHCDFCAAHFVTTGPDAAARLVELSHDEPALRNVMEWFYGYWQQAAWAGLLAAWLGVPIAHHLAPAWIYKWLQIPMGLPPREPIHTHEHRNGSAPADDPVTPPPTPFAGMDIDSLLAMAKSMGIEVPDFSAMMGNEYDADATAETDETGQEADAAETPASAPADSDTGE